MEMNKLIAVKQPNAILVTFPLLFHFKKEITIDAQAIIIQKIVQTKIVNNPQLTVVFVQ